MHLPLSLLARGGAVTSKYKLQKTHQMIKTIKQDRATCWEAIQKLLVVEIFR